MARRGENIYKRKDGRWEGRILIHKGIYQYLYAKSYKEIKEKMLQFQITVRNTDDNLNQPVEKAVPLLENWIKGEVLLRIKDTTYENYYYCMYKHIIPFFQLSENNLFTKESVILFVKYIEKNSELSDASKRKILTVFKLALKEILKDSPHSGSLVSAVRLPRLNTPEVQVFSKKEQNILENTILQSSDKRYLGLILCFYTGIRLGELCALKWSDIDIDTGMISITKTLSRSKNFGGMTKTSLKISSPKSNKSFRKIPLPNFLITMIREECQHIKEDNSYVLSGTGTPIEPRVYQQLYKKLLINTNIPERKFHAIRHTFATRALELGVDIKTLSEILGHSNVSITLNTYTHSLMEHKRAAIQKFDDMHIHSCI